MSPGMTEPFGRTVASTSARTGMSCAARTMHSVTASTESGSVVPDTTVMTPPTPSPSSTKAMVSCTSGTFAASDCADPDGLASEVVFRLCRDAGRHAHASPAEIRKIAYGYARHVRQEQHAKLEMAGKHASELARQMAPRTVDVPWELGACLQSLPPADHDLLMAYYDEELTGGDLAGRLGMKESTLRVRIKRICDRVRKCVEGNRQ